MVFCYQNCSDVKKKCFRELLKFEAESQEFAEKIEITITICSTEQFLVTEFFYHLFLEVSRI